MFNTFQDEDYIRFKMSSENVNISQAVEKARKFFEQYFVTEMDGQMLIIKELLNNAIEHGNKRFKDLAVFATIAYIGNNRFKIQVEDQGEGFDYRRVILSLPKANHIRQRGLSLVNSFSDQMLFNEKGNSVTVFTTIKRKTEFNVISRETDGREWQVIRPTGDVTSEHAEEFRKVLIRLLDGKCPEYLFDLELVEDIDSIALSIFIIFSKMVRERLPDFKLVIVNAGADINNLIRMTYLDKIYELR